MFIPWRNFARSRRASGCSARDVAGPRHPSGLILQNGRIPARAVARTFTPPIFSVPSAGRSGRRNRWPRKTPRDVAAASQSGRSTPKNDAFRSTPSFFPRAYDWGFQIRCLPEQQRAGQAAGAAVGSCLSTLNPQLSTIPHAVHRDPANAGRRFIPLLLDDCALPDTLRHCKYVNFREESEASTIFDQGHHRHANTPN